MILIRGSSLSRTFWGWPKPFDTPPARISWIVLLLIEPGRIPSLNWTVMIRPLIVVLMIFGAVTSWRLNDPE